MKASLWELFKRTVFGVLGLLLVLAGLRYFREGWEIGFGFALCFNALYMAATGCALLIVAIKGDGNQAEN